MTVDAYEIIELQIARKYGKETTTRKAAGDFMMNDDHAVNVKSNNVDKQNYSPNMLSIRRLHEWVFEDGKDISFVFVDYKMVGGELKILKESELIPVHHISWDCLSIEAQGYGVIQKVGDLKVDEQQTKRQFYQGFLTEYARFREKERKKHEKFSGRFISDLGSII